MVSPAREYNITSRINLGASTCEYIHHCHRQKGLEHADIASAAGNSLQEGRREECRIQPMREGKVRLQLAPSLSCATEDESSRCGCAEREQRGVDEVVANAEAESVEQRWVTRHDSVVLHSGLSITRNNLLDLCHQDLMFGSPMMHSLTKSHIQLSHLFWRQYLSLLYVMYLDLLDSGSLTQPCQGPTVPLARRTQRN